MKRPWYAGLAPEYMMPVMIEHPLVWGSWVCLDAHRTQILLFELELEAQRHEVELQIFVHRLEPSGDSNVSPGWSVSAKCLTGVWNEVQ
jgi:hypothetical protein